MPLIQRPRRLAKNLLWRAAPRTVNAVGSRVVVLVNVLRNSWTLEDTSTDVKLHGFACPLCFHYSQHIQAVAISRERGLRDCEAPARTHPFPGMPWTH